MADGLAWDCTGVVGEMDDQGFIHMRGRAKRMIISSGYNVYPGQIENILDAHEYVQMSCVIGVPDPYKMQKVQAFVKLAQGVPATEETKRCFWPTAARMWRSTPCRMTSSSRRICQRLWLVRWRIASWRKKNFLS